MKTINIFGKRMSILAILMAALIVGTASAAVFTHYATLDGNIEITAPVFVTGVDIGGTGDLVFGSPASFEISNTGDIPVIVVIGTTVFHNGNVLEDDEGIYVDYDVIDDGQDTIEEGEVLVPPGGLTVHVDFDTDEFVYPGMYNVQVDVMVYEGGEEYSEFGGNNAMETLLLTHKEGFGDDGAWNPIGDVSTLDFVQMGNEFYYELDSTNLIGSTDYAIIYYADQEDRYVNWGGIAPGVIDTFVTDIDGNAVVTGCVDLNMNLPSLDDENYPVAKIWIIPTSDLGIPPAVMGAWNPTLYLYEYDVLTYYIDTNIVV